MIFILFCFQTLHSCQQYPSSSSSSKHLENITSLSEALSTNHLQNKLVHINFLSHSKWVAAIMAWMLSSQLWLQKLKWPWTPYPPPGQAHAFSVSRGFLSFLPGAAMGTIYGLSSLACVSFGPVPPQNLEAKRASERNMSLGPPRAVGCRQSWPFIGWEVALWAECGFHHSRKSRVLCRFLFSWSESDLQCCGTSMCLLRSGLGRCQFVGWRKEVGWAGSMPSVFRAPFAAPWSEHFCSAGT